MSTGGGTGSTWFATPRRAATSSTHPIPNALPVPRLRDSRLNADVPYDRFVAEHIAGDLLPDPRRHPVEGFNESILGTGFWLLGEQVHSPVDIRQDEADRLDNMIDVYSKTFLGLTVACARCHDHKFDAISTNDYYALYGLLESSSYRLVRFDAIDHNRRIAERLSELRDRHAPGIRRAMADAMRPGAERVADYLRGAAAVRGGEPSEAVCRERGLDAATLDAWVGEVEAAAKNSGNPFNPWAVLGTAPDYATRRRTLREEWARPPGQSRNAATILVDYARPGPGDWLPDDVTFGLRPVRVGEVRLGTDPRRPIESVVTTSAAQYDRTWAGLKYAAGDRA